MKTIRIKTGILYLLLFILSLSRPVLAEDENAYLSVTGPCNLEFPRDHGDHPGYRTEWWYYTGNLRTADGDRYGFQLTFFRRQLSPPPAEDKWPSRPSAWRTSQVYLAHAAVSDINGRQHRYSEDAARAALGMAGVDRRARSTKIFLKNWSVQIEALHHRIKVSAADFSYELTFTPAKPLVLHGQDGYSPKGATPERASCYYSFTRLEGQGRITVGGRTVAVSGTAWMDHEFSTDLLEPGITGWDWFSLQLFDNTEIMVFLLRTVTGGLHPASSGTFIHTDGSTRHLAFDAIRMEVLDTWHSKKSAARYPARWRLQLLPLSFDAEITSNLPDQEMHTTVTTGVTYWEGSVSVAGTKANLPVKGEGYVELTGYAEAFDVPM
jgi:predicted secreted hydrolase